MIFRPNKNKKRQWVSGKFIPLHLSVSERRNQRILHLFISTVLFFNACQAKPTLEEQFVEKDTTPPQVLSITPAHGATEVVDRPAITIAFNEPMDAGTLNNSTVTVRTQAGTAAIGSYEYSRESNTLLINIVQNLYLNTEYVIHISADVKDIAGNSIREVSSLFTTDVCPKARNGKQVFDGAINAMVKIGCNIFIGGNFQNVSEASRFGVALDANSSNKTASFIYQDINGTVFVVASDGSGGWYIGGEFTRIGNLTRNRLAHIAGNGEVLPWNPNADGVVSAIHVSGSIVYVGGQFSAIGGQQRNRIAAISANGSATNWNPDITGIAVYAIAEKDSNIFLGGDFSAVGGITRNNLASVNVEGALLSWDPDANGTISAIAVSDSRIIVGGGFKFMGSETRNNLAAFDMNLELLPWIPETDENVSALAISGTTLYVAGDFTSIAGELRNYLAAFDIDGNLLAWDPSPDAGVTSIAVTNSTVYVGGKFENIGGFPRERLAAIGIDGLLRPWNPRAQNQVLAMAVSDNVVYAGGYFVTMGGLPRSNLAALSTDGTLLPWNPGADNTVYAMESTGSTLFIAGHFTNIGGSARSGVAALNVNGEVLNWNPNANDYVSRLELEGNTLYMAGAFTTLGGVSRTRLGAISLVNDCLFTYTPSCLQDWNPIPNNTVATMAISGSIIYLGGSFTCIGSGCTPGDRNRLAAVDSSGVLLDWNPNANNSVNSIAVSGSTIYIGGNFTCIGAGCTPGNRNRLATVDSAGILQSWNPNANNYVQQVSIFDDIIYVRGGFTNISGMTRSKVAAFDSDGNLLSFAPQVEIDGVMISSGSTIYSVGQGSIVSLNTDGSVNW